MRHVPFGSGTRRSFQIRVAYSTAPRGRRARPLKRWCCWRGLNSRPLPYQGSALPLSYNSQGPSARLPLAPGRGVPQPLDAGRACCQVHGHGKARQIPAQTCAVARRKAGRSAAGESAPPQGPSTGQGCGGSRAKARPPTKAQGIKPGFPQPPIWAICQPKGQRPQA